MIRIMKVFVPLFIIAVPLFIFSLGIIAEERWTAARQTGLPPFKDVDRTVIAATSGDRGTVRELTLLSGPGLGKEIGGWKEASPAIKTRIQRRLLATPNGRKIAEEVGLTPLRAQRQE